MVGKDVRTPNTQECATLRKPSLEPCPADSNKVLIRRARGGLPAGPGRLSTSGPGGSADRLQPAQQTRKGGALPQDSLPGSCLNSTNQAPRSQRKAGFGYLQHHWRKARVGRRCSAGLPLCITALCRPRAHKIDLGEIIHLHFTFSCSGTLPAAALVLPGVRKRQTRRSPAAVNGAPLPLMNLLSIFKLLQIRLPFIETVFYVSTSTFCCAWLPAGCRQLSLGAPRRLCRRQRAQTGQGGAPAASGSSKLAERSQQNQYVLHSKNPCSWPRFPHHHVPYSLLWETRDRSLLSSAHAAPPSVTTHRPLSQHTGGSILTTPVHCVCLSQQCEAPWGRVFIYSVHPEKGLVAIYKFEFKNCWSQTLSFQETKVKREVNEFQF